ncbi:hypothetical protein A5639_24480 [Mycolicibacterium conceptionense]|nr:hypothetical protein A5639_24480 [Mycolicibacterium conceptionense]
MVDAEVLARVLHDQAHQNPDVADLCDVAAYGAVVVEADVSGEIRLFADPLLQVRRKVRILVSFVVQNPGQYFSVNGFGVRLHLVGELLLVRTTQTFEQTYETIDALFAGLCGGAGERYSRRGRNCSQRQRVHFDLPTIGPEEP